MALRTVDLTYRKRDYRIAEPIRSEGASIHRGGDAVPCAGCFKTIAASTPRLYERGLNVGAHCLLCAFKTGLLVELPDRTVAAGREAR